MINRFLQLFIFILFLASNLLCQIEINDNSYKRLEGDADSLSLKANIIQLAQRLSGNYEVYSPEINTRASEIDGHINEDNLAVINQLGSNNPILEGVFVDDRFTGLWNIDKNGKTIELIESYPEGSMPLNVYYLRSEAKLIDEEVDSPTAEIELTMIYPVKTINDDSSVRYLDQCIRGHFIDADINYQHPDSLLTHAQKAFFKLYREQNKDWQESCNAFDWLKETNMSVCYNSEYILCLEYLDYVYTGGAHGMTNQSFDIFNLKTGTMISFQDIFKSDAVKRLSDILTSQLRSDRHIPDSISLKEAGFFVDVIKPGTNIYLNGSGIGFIYNQYEIAPYSVGISNIFIDYDQLNGVLKENTPIYKIAESY